MSPTPECKGIVVVVEDEEDSRELLRELLESRGYAVATAEDGLRAVHLLGTTPRVCLVILDLTMPVMDGFGVLRALASDPRLSALPVCISTSTPDRVPAGLPCLPKPIDVDQLFALVAAHCQEHG